MSKLTIRCVITDDEPVARKGLQGYIEKIDFLELVAVCEDAIQLNTVLKQQVDLLFLDIEMPYITRIEFLKNVTNPPKVIFTLLMNATLYKVMNSMCLIIY
jgi:two-component SAPR family response regulator